MKTTMKTLKKAVLALLFALTPMLAFAQANTLTQTTLSAAITSSQTVFNVASATGITAATGAPGTSTTLYVQDTSGAGEAMTVVAVSSTTVTVARGSSGTVARGHVSGAMVLAGRPNWFYVKDPGGSCTTANLLVTPFVNILTGRQWLCSTITLSWVPGFNNDLTPGSASVTTAVASAAGVVLPSGPLFHVTGTSAITGFTIPVGCNATGSGACSFVVIPDAVFSWTAAGNIGVASSALPGGAVVANHPVTFFWDAKNSKWLFQPGA